MKQREKTTSQLHLYAIYGVTDGCATIYAFEPWVISSRLVA